MSERIGGAMRWELSSYWPQTCAQVTPMTRAMDAELREEIMSGEGWQHCDDCPNVYRWSCDCFGLCLRGKGAPMNLTEELLPQAAPLSDRFEQIWTFVRSMGYEVVHGGGKDDDTDWDVTFVPGSREPNNRSLRWTYHSDTRQGLAKTLVRHVWRWE